MTPFNCRAYWLDSDFCLHLAEMTITALLVEVNTFLASFDLQRDWIKRILYLIKLYFLKKTKHRNQLCIMMAAFFISWNFDRSLYLRENVCTFTVELIHFLNSDFNKYRRIIDWNKMIFTEHDLNLFTHKCFR
jgi:hypothetical protein